MTHQEIIASLAEGETYVGGIIAADGTITYTILLPGNFTGTWKKANEWAKSIGGELPNRTEQANLYANHADQFEKDWYWSGVEHQNPDYAWIQSFLRGSQSSTLKALHGRARAVRRLIIQ